MANCTRVAMKYPSERKWTVVQFLPRTENMVDNIMFTLANGGCVSIRENVQFQAPSLVRVKEI